MRFEHPVYPITKDSETIDELVSQIEVFVSKGVTLAQVRSKRLTSAQLFEAVRKSLDFSKGTETKLIVNDRVDIALAADADGVHVGQTDLQPKYVRELIGKDKIIGYSTHNLDQFHEALKMPVDYIALGPVFATKTKKNADPAIGLETLRECVALAGSKPLVAIGGLTAANLASVSATGIQAAALISALDDDPTMIDQLTELWSGV